MKTRNRVLSMVLAVAIVFTMLGCGIATVYAEKADLSETAATPDQAAVGADIEAAETGTQAESIVSVAQGEVGGPYTRVNKYTQWYYGYDNAQDWCAIFVSWCASKAGISADIVPRLAGAHANFDWFKSRGLWHGKKAITWTYNEKTRVSENDSSYVPQAGDIILRETYGGVADGPDHVELVTGCDGNRVYTIGGNTGGYYSGGVYYSYVKSKSYSLWDSDTWGYCSPAYVDSPNPDPNYDPYNPDSYTFPTRDIWYQSTNTMTGSDVKWIQAVLRKLGYGIDIDGSFGPASEAVVKQFQSDHGLAVDGSVGPATRQALYDAWQNFINPIVDVGTNFYAYIINTASWKMATNVSGNVALHAETGQSNQVWWFERQSDGSYAIINTWDQNVLDDQDFGQTNGSNVQVCGSNGSSAQRWFIYGESGAYSFRAACGQLRLDVNGGSSEDGTNIQMWENNDTAAQKFQIWILNKAGASHLNVYPGTSTSETVFTWSKALDTTRYNIKIWNGTYWVGDPYKVIWGETGTTCSIILPAGYYEAYIDSENNYSTTMSDNVVKFTVEEGATEPPTEAPTEPPTEAPTESPTDAPTEAPTVKPTEPPTEAKEVRIYFLDKNGWAKSYSGVYCYSWIEGQSGGTAYPGQRMSYYGRDAATGYDMYTALIPTGISGLIFNNGFSAYDVGRYGIQTVDITDGFDANRCWYPSENITGYNPVGGLIPQGEFWSVASYIYSDTELPTEPPTEAPTEAPTEPPVQPTEPPVAPTEPVDPDAPQLVVSDKTAIIGSTVSVDITVKNNPGIAGMTLDVAYDSSVLTLTEAKDGGILGVNTHKPELTSPYTLSWSNDTASENITANGVVATLVFTVSEAAELGAYPITLSYDYDNFDIYDVDINKVKFAVVNGKVTVKDVLYGDVNGDGKVNNIDRVYLTRYLAKWADYQEINLANADVNDDGRVNNMDKVILTRHLAKWGAYATLPCQP